MYTLIGNGRLTATLANVDAAAVPADHTRVVKAITLCNITAVDVWVTFQFGDENILFRYTVPGYGSREENTITIPFIDQVMPEATRITGRAEVADAIDYRISGTEWEQ